MFKHPSNVIVCNKSCIFAQVTAAYSSTCSDKFITQNTKSRCPQSTNCSVKTKILCRRVTMPKY